MKILLGILMLVISSVIINAQVVPILDMKVRGLLGGFSDGEFVDAETAFKRLEKNQKYRLFGFGATTLPTDIPLIVKAPSDRGPCNDFYSVSTESEINSGIAVGTNADWDILPRPIRKISLTNRTYLKIVRDFLRSKGLTRARARIEQAFRVDLEGDGISEVIISASSHVDPIQPYTRAGDYSFVLLRKNIKGQIRNILLGGEFLKKKIQFHVPSRFEVSAIADLSGDRQMEIVLYSEYYEGNGAWVIQIKDGKMAEIKQLNTSCGV